MARNATVVEPPVEVTEPTGPGGSGPAAPGNGDGGEGRPAAVPRQAYQTGLVLTLAAIFMFFMGLTSAFIVRKGLGRDWIPIALPSILWWNTAVLLVSSGLIERARHFLRQHDERAFGVWWRAAAALGVLFLFGQLLAWRQLVQEGVYLATNPASSFFYVFTAAHGLHVVGGLVALAVVAWWRWDRSRRMGRELAAELAAVYWHFLDGLWVFLFLLLKMGQ